jgi:large subunit GTPase 1
VDARNPYFFYSADLEKYIEEVNKNGDKQFLLLINKSDFLSPDLIAHWNEYFTQKGVNHIFFSAIDEQAKIDAEELLDHLEENKESEEEDDSNASQTCSSDSEQDEDQKLIAENPIEKSEMELEIERQEREDA